MANISTYLIGSSGSPAVGSNQVLSNNSYASFVLNTPLDGNYTAASATYQYPVLISGENIYNIFNEINILSINCIIENGVNINYFGGAPNEDIGWSYGYFRLNGTDLVSMSFNHWNEGRFGDWTNSIDIINHTAYLGLSLTQKRNLFHPSEPNGFTTYFHSSGRGFYNPGAKAWFWGQITHYIDRSMVEVTWEYKTPPLFFMNTL